MVLVGNNYNCRYYSYLVGRLFIKIKEVDFKNFI